MTKEGEREKDINQRVKGHKAIINLLLGSSLFRISKRVSCCERRGIKGTQSFACYC
jgi:hypothetical protein